jgi:hypothetical protein
LEAGSTNGARGTKHPEYFAGLMQPRNTPTNLLNRVLLSGFAVLLLLPIPGLAQSVAEPQVSNPVAPFKGTTGYIFTEQALLLMRNGKGTSAADFNNTLDFPYRPQGAAFLIAPNLLMGAGMHVAEIQKERCFWIPAQLLSAQISDSCIYEVMSVAYSYSGSRGIDENFALWKLKRTAPLPVFPLALGPLKMGDVLQVCMDNGTLQPVTIKADEGEKSVFIEEQFSAAASGSAVVNTQGKAVGILIPGPHSGAIQDAAFSPVPIYGNAIQRFSAMPAKVLQPVLAANVQYHLLRGTAQETVSYLPYLNMLCGSDEDLLCAAARNGQDFLLDTFIQMACNRGCFDVNRRDASQSALLHILAQRGQLSLPLQHLLQCAQLQVDLPDGIGKTALQYAVQLGNTTLVSLLLQRGASVQVRQQNAEPLLFAATGHGSVELCRQLLTHGAWDALTTADQKQLKMQVKRTSNAALKQLFKKYKTRRS